MRILDQLWIFSFIKRWRCSAEIDKRFSIFCDIVWWEHEQDSAEWADGPTSKVLGDNEKQVRTRKFVSKFLNRPNATNLHTALSASLTKLSERQLLQISMDGPNVNWGVLRLIREEGSKQEFPGIVNIGSCGLHNVQRAFESGMEVSELSLGKVLKGPWLLSHDSLAQRDTFGMFLNGMIYFPWLSLIISISILGLCICFGTL